MCSSVQVLSPEQVGFKVFLKPALLLQTGPGVGKGRQIASLVFENILRGRTKVSCQAVFALRS